MLAANFVKLHGQPAAHIVFDSLGVDGATVRFCQFLVLHDQRQVSLAFYASPGVYDTLRPAAEQMAVSLQIGDGPVPSQLPFTVQPPPAWTQVTPDTPHTLAMFLSNGTTWNKAEAMIKIDAGRPKNVDAVREISDSGLFFPGRKRSTNLKIYTDFN